MKKIIGITTIGLVLLLAFSFVSAYQGDPMVQGPDFDEERHLEMQTAFENMDYQTWVTLMQGKGRVLEVVNEDNFEQFSQMHEAKISGDIETANSIREELGLGLGQGKGSGQRQGHGKGMDQRNKNCLN